MDNKFKIGDVVHLNSDVKHENLMTVELIYKEAVNSIGGVRIMVSCTFLLNSSIKSLTFNQDLLTKFIIA